MTQNQTVRELMPLTSISRRAIVLITTMALLLAVACSRKDADTASTDAVAVANAAITTVYAGGDILTMAGREPAYAEALAVLGQQFGVRRVEENARAEIVAEQHGANADRPGHQRGYRQRHQRHPDHGR